MWVFPGCGRPHACSTTSLVVVSWSENPGCFFSVCRETGKDWIPPTCHWVAAVGSTCKKLRRKWDGNLDGGFKYFFHPYLGKIAIWTIHIFQMGWFNHQPVMFLRFLRIFGRNACSCPPSRPSRWSSWRLQGTWYHRYLVYMIFYKVNMDVSENSGTPKSSILIGFSIINHPFWGIHIFWKHLYQALTFVAFRSWGRNGLLKPVNTKRWSTFCPSRIDTIEHN